MTQAKRVAHLNFFVALTVSALACATGCESMGPELGTEVSVDVFGAGNGVGRVTAPDAAVNIDCLLGPSIPDSGTCNDEFFDAGAGGVFSLFAEANPGSTFIGWDGCNSTNDTECVLTFSTSGAFVGFTVTASFDLDTTNVCNLTFGTSPGYILCEESPSSCTFYTLLNDVDSCGTRCASFGSTCIQSIGDTDDTCSPGEVGSCDDVVGDRLCECTKLD